ncbi:BlaI/MecI/CopY family transcriptional regulator [Aeromicrobium alkaliterrae]|uniref:BlaI/MecI/CopY family transcriptional regulator n=1 Tax=Aeromicrobium alkaliterrae TaxID=302168 RepID=A0ABN2JR13_9ACTN
MRSFGDLESRLMHALWPAEDGLTVHEVIDRLETPVAYTTAITVIERLRAKGWLTREKDGRAFRYVATRTESQYAAQLMGEALDEVDDRAGALLSFADQLTPAEAQRLREALARAEGEHR